MCILGALALTAIAASSSDGEESLMLLQTRVVSLEDPNEDSPVCKFNDVQTALAQMHGTCATQVTEAVLSNTPLSEKERCVCYMEVDEEVAASLQCRTMPAKKYTLAQEYKTCKAAANKLLGRNGPVCSLQRIKPHLDKMDEECQTDMYTAIEFNKPMSFEQRCECFLQVDSSALELDCRAMPGKTTTVAEDWQECLEESVEEEEEEEEPEDTDNPHPVCEMSQVQSALDQMHGNCANKVTDAVLSNTPLTESERCLCYLQVDEQVATSINCRAMPAKHETLAYDWRQCKKDNDEYSTEKNMCAFSRVKPQLDKMTEACQVRLYKAIETNSPLPENERCECYRQIDEDSAMALDCHSMPAKTSTIAQEWQNCATN